MSTSQSPDQHTADAFASSWLNLPRGSVYTKEQFEGWVDPLTAVDFRDKSVLELGCGNASLMIHAASWNPQLLVGVDLGDSVDAAFANLDATEFDRWTVIRTDLTTYRSEHGFDLVYCIGVLHHLADPIDGFRAVVANVKPGGRFHCWVYAREGDLVVRLLVEPLRRVFSRFPWWFTKYVIATPLAIPTYLYAKGITALCEMLPAARKFPLSAYFQWISRREIAFVRHVIFDQLVAPTTQYIRRIEIEHWLGSVSNVSPGSEYIILRNGNSWKFGGSIREHGAAAHVSDETGRCHGP